MFKILKQIVETKKKINEDLDLDPEFNFFMAQRWISMISPQHCVVLNESTNSLHTGLKSKSEYAKLLQSIIPQNHIGHIKYIKKTKQSKDVNSNIINFLADALEISKREATQYAENNPGIVKSLKKHLGENK